MYDLILDDVIHWAETYTGPQFHAMLFDPPYHLTSIIKRFGNPGAAPAKGGVYNRASKGFMGQQWDGGELAFRPETWAALTAHLYPGGFGMAFASSRGWHRIAVAIEDAGLIIHPTIWNWNYLSGFPKATRIKGDSAFNGHRYGLQALKPASEPIILFAKAKGECYNILQEQLTETNSLLEDLWRTYANSAEEVSRAAQAVNIVLSNALKTTNPNYKENGLNVASAERLSTKPPAFSGTTAENGADTVHANVTFNIEQNSLQGSVNIVGENLESGIHCEPESIVAVNALLPPANSPCYLTPSEMGIDTNTTVGILQSSLEKARLDLSTIWLWRLISVDLCNQANRFTTETAEKTITELRILNYILQKLMSCSLATQLKKSLLNELSLYARDAAQVFIGLVMFPKEQGPTVQNALEPIIVFQKPYEGRPVDSIVETGAGALWIDGGRIPTGENLNGGAYSGNTPKLVKQIYGEYNKLTPDDYNAPPGRWPANFILTHSPDCNGTCVPDCPVRLFDEQAGESTSTGGLRDRGDIFKQGGTSEMWNYGDSGSASRMFHRSDWAYEIAEQLANAAPVHYEPKASNAEREAGLDGLEAQIRHRVNSGGLENEPRFAPIQAKNHHPTVKPISLTKYLATLLLPPAAYAPRRICVPFAGVASEMIGAILAGWEEVIGVEKTPAYIPIARARLKWWSQWPGWGQTDVDKTLAAKEQSDIQLSLFGTS